MVDVETTGLNASNCSIIEVSAIRFENFKPVAHFNSFTKSSSELQQEIIDITGITNYMLVGAPEFWQLIPSLNVFIGNSNLVGHNLPFDLKFLYINGLNFTTLKRKYFDTLDIAKHILKKQPSKWDKETESYEPDFEADFDIYDYKLETLCDYYSIIRSNAHRSSSDCLATGILFENLVYEKKNIAYI